MNPNTESKLATIDEQITENLENISALKRERYSLQKLTVTPVDKTAERKAEKARKYTTTNGLTIHNLRLAGNRVVVTHVRYTAVPGERITRNEYGEKETQEFISHQPIPSFMRGTHTFESRGGATYISVTSPTGELTVVSSHCHEFDAFDYKLGVKKALDLFSAEDAKSLLNPIGVTSKQETELANA